MFQFLTEISAGHLIIEAFGCSLVLDVSLNCRKSTYNWISYSMDLEKKKSLILAFTFSLCNIFFVLSSFEEIVSFSF